MSSRRRLHGKQADPRITNFLAESLPWSAEFLGLHVFRIASLSRRWLRMLNTDVRMLASVLSEQVRFSGMPSADAAARALFKRLPEYLACLDLEFGKRYAHGSGHLSDETFDLLAGKLPQRLKSIRIGLGYAKAPAALLAAIVKQATGNLRELRLHACMPRDAFQVLVGGLPQSLTKLSLELVPGQECQEFPEQADLGLLAQRLPSSLVQLSLGLGGLVWDGLLEDLARRMPALRQLERLSLDLRQGDIESPGIKALLDGLPIWLTSLDLNLGSNDLDPLCVTHAFRHVLRSLSNLEELRLDFEECEIGCTLPGCIARGLPISLVELSLEFGGCDLTNEAVQEVCQAMAAQVGLQKLSLSFRACNVAGGVAELGQHMPPNLVSLSLNFFNSDIGDDDAVAVARSLPSSLKALDLSFGGCSLMTAVCMQRWFESLPGCLRELKLEFEWLSLSQVTSICLPRRLEAFDLHANALYSGHKGNSPILKALAIGLRELLALRKLRLDFGMCDLSLRQARRIMQSLPSAISHADLDFGGCVTAQDTEEKWKQLLGAAKERYGGSVRLPESGKTGEATRAAMQELFALMAPADAGGVADV
mmetsp:Transcript_104045/g.303748  ORF Transcript_104045/g.303748 Transcript_104045/m.303748 type:complete len:593 (-) Transcript_104045:64-1842(-)